MSIAFPRTDILTAVNFADQKFQLIQRQEFSRHANGITRGKDLGSALWRAEYTTVPLPNDDALVFEAMLHSLDGVIQQFYAGDLRRSYPRAHSDGSFTDSGTVHTIGGDGKSLRLQALPAGFVLSPGDYLAFDYGAGPSRALHQVVESATADGTGLTPSFEVRPHLRPGLTVGTAVTLKDPMGRFVLEPNSVQSSQHDQKHAVISFSAIQFL